MEIRQVKWDEVENVVELYDEYDRLKAPRPAEEKMHKAGFSDQVRRLNRHFA